MSLSAHSSTPRTTTRLIHIGDARVARPALTIDLYSQLSRKGLKDMCLIFKLGIRILLPLMTWSALVPSLSTTCLKMPCLRISPSILMLSTTTNTWKNNCINLVVHSLKILSLMMMRKIGFGCQFIDLSRRRVRLLIRVSYLSRWASFQRKPPRKILKARQDKSQILIHIAHHLMEEFLCQWIRLLCLTRWLDLR